MSKILVTKAVKTQYPVGAGAPILVLGGGRGGQARGRTLRERAGGFLGGTVGVLGALAGQHRSLGGLAQSMISGGAQGAGLGAGLARKVAVGRRGQAKADLNEQIRNQYAQARAEGRLPPIKGYAFPPVSMQRQAVTDLNIREAAAQEAEKQRRAEEIAAAQARGKDFGEQERSKLQDAEELARLFGGNIKPRLAALAAASQPMQTQSPIDLGGKTAVMRPVTNAAGVQIAPDASQVNPNMLPAPSPSAQEASAGTEISNIESASDTEAMQTGTDMKDSEDPVPLGDSVDWDKSNMTLNEQNIMEQMRRLEQLQQEQQQRPQGNFRQTTLQGI